MKTLAVSFVLALGLAAPAFAEPPAPASSTTEATPAAAEPDASIPLDALLEEATTPEARIAVLRRCAGPPPRLVAKDAKKPEVLAEKIEAAANGG